MSLDRQLAAVIAVAGFASAQAGTVILFDFESPPSADSGDGANPTFESDELTIAFSSTPPPIAQWVNDFRSLPFAGIGSMRLTDLDFGPNLSSAQMGLSTPVETVGFYGTHFVGAVSSGFTITAFSPQDEVLASVVIPQSGTPFAPEWTLVSFSGVGLIGKLTFDGSVNFSYWDEMEFALPKCPWDLDGDGNVGIVDFLMLIGSFGPCDDPDNCPGDFDDDDVIGVTDFLALIGNFGPCPGSPCVWDIDGNGVVDLVDLLAVLDNLGSCDDPDKCPWDVNGDGVVDGLDLAGVVTHFGPCP